MFRPLAMTKTLAMAASGVWRSPWSPPSARSSSGAASAARRQPDRRALIDVYRPVLDCFIDRPAPLLWLLAATFLVGVGGRRLARALPRSMAGGLLAVGADRRRGRRGKAFGMAPFVLVGLVADANVVPLGREFLTPLDEGIVMDMPISVPRMSIAQGTDDLKATDMVLCRFPEVAMVTGKLGRAETPTDPAPLDMIETMVEFHPREFWPARSIGPGSPPDRSAPSSPRWPGGLIDPPGRATEGEIKLHRHRRRNQ